MTAPPSAANRTSTGYSAPCSVLRSNHPCAAMIATADARKTIALPNEPNRSAVIRPPKCAPASSAARPARRSQPAGRATEAQLVIARRGARRTPRPSSGRWRQPSGSAREGWVRTVHQCAASAMLSACGSRLAGGQMRVARRRGTLDALQQPADVARNGRRSFPDRCPSRRRARDRAEQPPFTRAEVGHRRGVAWSAPRRKQIRQ